jgi:hypothetical protein
MRIQVHPARIGRTPWLTLVPFVISCSGNPRPGIMSDLLAHRPVCLEIDWGSARPEFYGRPAPDTLLLLPSRGEPHGFEKGADAWGSIELAKSQADREGGGWLWWVRQDTLQILAGTPTMEDLGVWSIRPGSEAAAQWGTAGSESKAGTAQLQSYECGTRVSQAQSSRPQQGLAAVPEQPFRTS